MLKSILSIFLKTNCPLCQRATDDAICYDCQQQLKGCQLKDPKKFWQGELPSFVWGQYEGKLKRAIAALKYDNNPEIGELLGFCLGEMWQTYPIIKTKQKPIVVPIPLHPKKQQERGFNQAEVIARGFCQITRYPLASQGLIRIRQTDTMFALTPQQRKTNVKQAFKLGKLKQNSLKSNSILLIDDIYTTGATATEAAQVFVKKGIKVLGIVTVATPRL